MAGLSARRVQTWTGGVNLIERIRVVAVHERFEGDQLRELAAQNLGGFRQGGESRPARSLLVLREVTDLDRTHSWRE